MSVCALQNCLDCGGPLRTHQPLKLSNDLSLRSFIAEHEPSNRYGDNQYRGKRKQRIKSQCRTKRRRVVIKPCGTRLSEQGRHYRQKTDRRFSSCFFHNSLRRTENRARSKKRRGRLARASTKLTGSFDLGI